MNTNQTPNITVIASGRRKDREQAMRSWHYKHKQKNFKPKVETECILFESVLLEIFKLIKEQEGKSRAVIIERMIIYLLEKDKGNENETAWNKSKRSYRRTLKNYEKEAKAKRKHLQKAKKAAEKKNYTFARIVRLAILEGIRKFQKENLFLNLQMKDFEIAISILEQKTKRDRKK
ncbi:hypothetical protein [Helicobacter pylori]|uniref:hypothetical protein n=1 Tax=Helicobacter pylori TaxID=210 RepID=UPI0038FCBD5F